MSRGLLSQLGTYYSWIDEEQHPIQPREVAARIDSPVREMAIPVPTDTRHPWLVAVAAAAAVLVLVGGAALLLRVIRSDTPVATTPQVDSFSSLTWSRLPHDEAEFGDGFEQVMDSVTVGGPGLVAVGQSGPGEDGEGRAAAWTSPDGITWSRVPHNDAIFDTAAMHSVTAGGPGLVAVGTSDQAAVWTSPDGFTWSRVPHNQAVFGGGEDGQYVAMQSVTAGGPGLVAVGIEGHPHGENVKAVVWTSVDGFTWSRVPHNDAVLGGAEDGQHTEMRSVTVGGPGLVAVGGDWSGVNGQEGGAAVWTSPDGIDWTRVPHDETLFGGGMNSVAVGGPGLVAVGWDTMGAAVWTSPDGIDWTRAPHNDAIFGGDRVEMSSVTVAGSGLVAVGWDTMGAAVWTSPDGIDWSRAPHNDAIFGTQEPDLPVLEMRSIAAGGHGLVAVGANGRHPTSGATKSDAAVWVTEDQ